MHLIVIILLIVLPTTVIVTATDEDKATMDALLSTITPTPKGWSSDTHFCEWYGVKCDNGSRVVSINLAYQFLYGALPTSLSSLSKLTALFLQDNHFSGQLPSLANLPVLRQAYFRNNKFTSIPVGVFSGLLNLEELSVANNPDLLLWPFPFELSDSPKLSLFDAANARVTGSIPDIFGSLPHLSSLSLSGNNLSDLLPRSLSRSSIQTFTVSNQHPGLCGSIEVLCGARKLSVVKLDGNQFTGAVPPCFVSLPYLSEVGLQNNQFQGQVPRFPERVNVNLGNNFSSCICNDPNKSMQTRLLVLAILTVLVGILFAVFRCSGPLVENYAELVEWFFRDLEHRDWEDQLAQSKLYNEDRIRRSSWQGTSGHNVNESGNQYVEGMTYRETGIEISRRQENVLIINNLVGGLQIGDQRTRISSPDCDS